MKNININNSNITNSSIKNSSWFNNFNIKIKIKDVLNKLNCLSTTSS